MCSCDARIIGGGWGCELGVEGVGLDREMVAMCGRPLVGGGQWLGCACLSRPGTGCVGELSSVEQ